MSTKPAKASILFIFSRYYRREYLPLRHKIRTQKNAYVRFPRSLFHVPFDITSMLSRHYRIEDSIRYDRHTYISRHRAKFTIEANIVEMLPCIKKKFLKKMYYRRRLQVSITGHDSGFIS